MGRQHQGMDRPAVRQVPEGSGEQGKMEKTGCKIIRGAPTTLAAKELMMMMMMMMMYRGTRPSLLAVVFSPPAERDPRFANSAYEFPSNEGKELYHVLLRCFDVQIGKKNTMTNQRNVSF